MAAIGISTALTVARPEVETMTTLQPLKMDQGPRLRSSSRLDEVITDVNSWIRDPSATTRFRPMFLAPEALRPRGPPARARREMGPRAGGRRREGRVQPYQLITHASILKKFFLYASRCRKVYVGRTPPKPRLVPAC